MNYYETKQKVNKKIDEQIETLDKGDAFDILRFTMTITAEFPVSNKIVMNRCIEWTKLDPNYEIKEDRIFKRKGEKE